MNDTQTLHPADQRALARCLAVEPAWTSLESAATAVGLKPNMMLHAGPPFVQPSEVSKPILHSAAVAAVFEGLATSFEAGLEALRAGEIELHPAQDHGVVTPLAAVVSASMTLQGVRDAAAPGKRSWAPLNGGGHAAAPRLGLCSAEALEHLRWLNGTLAQTLQRCLNEPVALLPIAVAGVRAGDDCHGLTRAATSMLCAMLVKRLGKTEHATTLERFLHAGPSFFLNLWMAAVKCMMHAAEDTPGASLLTAAGGNGAHTGVQVAGLPGHWLSADAGAPHGDLGGYPAERALGAVGDSAVLDAMGFGAMAFNYSPKQRENLGSYLPTGALGLPAVLLAGSHPKFGDLDLRVGLCARRVVEHGQPPVVSLGIVDKQGEAGRLGGGIFQPPLYLFEAAVNRLDES